jgi:hypothetical protein
MTMIDSDTHRQISHCWTSRLVVSSSFCSGPKTVARMIATTDSPVEMTNPNRQPIWNRM